MSTIAIPKKPASESWHPAFIVYQLRLRGLSLRRLARLHGFSESACTTAIHYPVPRIERLIADAVGVQPQEIWPARYNPDGTPKRGLHSKKGSTSARARNDHVEARK